MCRNIKLNRIYFIAKRVKNSCDSGTPQNFTNPRTAFDDQEMEMITEKEKQNVLLLCGQISIIKLKKGNTKIFERSIILWQQNQLICTQG
jgi:signal recognition particle subunit SEC65